METVTDPITLIPAMICVLGVPALAVYLFVSGVARADVTAISAMTLPGLVDVGAGP